MSAAKRFAPPDASCALSLSYHYHPMLPPSTFALAPLVCANGAEFSNRKSYMANAFPMRLPWCVYFFRLTRYKFYVQ